MSRFSLPHLEPFLGGYFHQDWTLEAPDSGVVVTRFLKRATPSKVRAIRRDVARLLSALPSEEALVTELSRMGCQVNFAVEGGSAAAWLRRLAVRLETAQATMRRRS